MGVIVVGMDDIPDFGDLAGLTRLYWWAVRRIRTSDLAVDGKAAILGKIEARFRAASAGITRFPRCA